MGEINNENRLFYCCAVLHSSPPFLLQKQILCQPQHRETNQGFWSSSSWLQFVHTCTVLSQDMLQAKSIKEGRDCLVSWWDINYQWWYLKFKEKKNSAALQLLEKILLHTICLHKETVEAEQVVKSQHSGKARPNQLHHHKTKQMHFGKPLLRKDFQNLATTLFISHIAFFSYLLKKYRSGWEKMTLSKKNNQTNETPAPHINPM